MMVWKDKLIYTYPPCQTVILQSTTGKRFRLKAVTRDRDDHNRYDDTGNVVPCDHSFVIGGIRVLRVKLNDRFAFKNQFRELNYGDWNRRIPMLNKGMILVEIANLCGMTPLGDAVELKGEYNG